MSQFTTGRSTFDEAITFLDPVTFQSTITAQGLVYLQSGSTLQEAIYNNGNVSGTVAINWNNSNIQSVKLTGNTTFTFTAPTNTGEFQLLIYENGTGGYSITLPTITWVGSPPVWNTTSNATNLLNIIYDGTQYIGTGSSGGIFGPSSSVIGDIVEFNNTTGNLIADTGIAYSNLAVKNASNTFTSGIQYLNGATLEMAIYNIGSSVSGTKAISWDNGNIQKATLTGVTTFTFTAPTNTGRYTLIIIQDGSGNRYVTLPTITWLGVAPKFNYSANGVTSFDIIYNGSTYYGVANNDGVLNQANAWSGIQTFSQAAFNGTSGNAVTFGGAVYYYFTDLGTTSGSVALNLQTNARFSMVMNGNTTLTFGVGPSSTDAVIQAYIYQDGTGGRTLTIGTSVLWPGGTAPTFDTTANSCVVLSAIYDSHRGKWIAFAGSYK